MNMAEVGNVHEGGPEENLREAQVDFLNSADSIELRLAMGPEAIFNPQNKAYTREEVASAIDKFNPENIEPYQNLSYFERDHYWKTESLQTTLDGRLSEWRQGVKEAFVIQGDKYGSLGTAKHDAFLNYFTYLSRAIREERVSEGKPAPEFLNAGAFTDNMAQEVFDTYFTGADKESRIDLFIKHVLEAKAAMQADKVWEKSSLTQADFDAQIRETAEWFANIFGANSAKIVERMTDIAGRLKENPALFDNLEDLITQSHADKVNNISDTGGPVVPPTPEPETLHADTTLSSEDKDRKRTGSVLPPSAPVADKPVSGSEDAAEKPEEETSDSDETSGSADSQVFELEAPGSDEPEKKTIQKGERKKIAMFKIDSMDVLTPSYIKDLKEIIDRDGIFHISIPDDIDVNRDIPISIDKALKEEGIQRSYHRAPKGNRTICTFKKVKGKR